MRTVTLNMIDRSRYDENEGGQPIEETVPCDIAVDEIRCYYPRKGWSRRHAAHVQGSRRLRGQGLVR